MNSQGLIVLKVRRVITSVGRRGVEARAGDMGTFWKQWQCFIANLDDSYVNIYFQTIQWTCISASATATTLSEALCLQENVNQYDHCYGKERVLA